MSKYLIALALLAHTIGAVALGAVATTWYYRDQAEALAGICLQQLAQQRQQMVRMGQAAIFEDKQVVNAKDTLARPIGDGSRVILVETRIPHPELLPKVPKAAPATKAKKATPALQAAPKAPPAPPAPPARGLWGRLMGWIWQR